ncbi:MAG: hypothetical protein H8E55_59315 [Pelagibacterales bacterium]|nr:hypothetical protein [Pelagibacterales bacterium]
MSESDFVKSIRNGFNKNKGILHKTEQNEELNDSNNEDEDEISIFKVVIDIKIKQGKNNNNLPETKDILKWCGNILSSTKP